MGTLTPRLAAATLAAFMVGFSAAATADNGWNDDKFAARLSGYNEVHFIAAPTPALRGAVSTQARGSFRAEIDDSAKMIHYELSFEGLVAAVTHAPAAVAALPPPCGGPRANTVSGTITPAQVLTATGQGIDTGEFDEVVRAIRAGRVYANVHSAPCGPGEIRGQLRGGDRGDDRD